MTQNIGKSMKKSAEIIKENFLQCILIALIFTAPMQVYSIIPIANTSFSTAIQFLSAPLMLAGSYAYYLMAYSNQNVNVGYVLRGFSDKNITNSAFTVVGKTLLYSFIYVGIPVIIAFVGVLLIVGIDTINNSEQFVGIVFISFLLITPFIVWSTIKVSIAQLSAICCVIENKTSSEMKSYQKIFKRCKIQIFLMNIPLLAIVLVPIIIEGYYIFGVSLITYPFAMMYAVCCYTFFAKFTLDQTRGVNSDYMEYQPSDRYAGVDKDLF